MIPRLLEILQKEMNIDPGAFPEDQFQREVLLRYIQKRINQNGSNYFKTPGGRKDLFLTLQSMLTR